MRILRGMRFAVLIPDGDGIPGLIGGDLAVLHLIAVERGGIGDPDLLTLLHLREGVVKSIRGPIINIV